jgi:large subunit ribosomal protein L25
MKFTIQAKKREAGRAEDNRAEGLIPAIIYSKEMESMPVSFAYGQFTKLYDDAGYSNLIDLSIEGKSEPMIVLIQDAQFDPVRRRIIHADLRQVNMNEELEAVIELEFVGESPAVKGLGGTLVKAREELNVSCLPKYLVGSIAVDISILNTFDDIVRVKDLIIPPGIKVLDDNNQVIVKVNAPLTEEQLKAMEEEGTKGVESVEVEEKKKEEEAVGEDGEKVEKGEEKKNEKKEDKKEEKKKKE